MKAYNVSVYDIDLFNSKGKGICSKEKVDKIIVYRTIFGVKEIITHQPFIIFDKRYFTSTIDMSFYEKYGFLLGVDERSIAYKNISSKSNLEEYEKVFLESDFLKYLRNYTDDGLDEEIIHKRIDQIKRKIK